MEQPSRRPRAAVTVEDRLGEHGIEGAAISIPHDRLEEREWPVHQGGGRSRVHKGGQKAHVGDIRQFRDGLVDDFPTVRVGDHDDPIAIGRNGGASRLDVVREPGERQLDRDRVDLPVA